MQDTNIKFYHLGITNKHKNQNAGGKVLENTQLIFYSLS